MDYHLHVNGRDIGVFPLEELRQRFESGQFTGDELLWREGMSDWQTLASVLQQEPSSTQFSTPPPLPPAPAAKVRPKRANTGLIVGTCLVVAALIVLGFFGVRTVNRVRPVFNELSADTQMEPSREAVVALASKPVQWNTNTLTEVDVRVRRREFRIRQYLEGYEERGDRNPSYDAEAEGLIKNWIASNYGGPVDTNLPSLSELSDKLAGNPAVTDPLVLTVAAVNTTELHEAIRRLERAVSGFDQSKHRAYPRLYATVSLAERLISDKADRLPVLDASAREQFKNAFADGSFTPDDQAEIAEILVNGWGRDFFQRNARTLHQIAQAAGKDFRWLALVLEGQYEINAAWRARGSGYANTVTEQGWKGFEEHLARARATLTEAWRLRPDLPLAPTLMIYVSLGDSGIEQMRVWFDRATVAQIDYPGAWREMLWGLRPRWYGSHEAMLALGVTAINTKRFDTDVPREFFTAVSDVESELNLPAGSHTYGRPDIWPHIREMCEGYIADPSHEKYRVAWRSYFSAVAYLAGKYDVARQQLDALHWKPDGSMLGNWGRDLSLMPLEVAARTGALGPQIDLAEFDRKNGDVAGALQIYAPMNLSSNADERTAAFIRDRVATLELEEHLKEGEWTDFLPTAEDLRGWCVVRGECQRLPDGSLEVQSGEDGHLLFCRAEVGTEFEVRGQFEVVQSSTRAFQAGLVMGLPDPATEMWDGFRIKRNADEGDVTSVSQNWSKRQILSRVVLNDETNSFSFRFQAGKVTASVNGREVFHEVAPPRNPYLATNHFMLGLGAFNDMNKTTIRYRNVQVRRLAAR